LGVVFYCSIETSTESNQ